MSECDRLPLNIQISDVGQRDRQARRAGRAGRGGLIGRPVTIRRIAGHQHHERERAEQGLLGRHRLGPRSPPLIMIPAQSSPQSDQQRADRGDQARRPAAGRPRQHRREAPAEPEVVDAPGTRATAQNARKLAAVTRSMPRTRQGPSRYESAWTT